MLYTIMEVDGKEIKLRLNASSTVQVEKQIGKNPINVLMALGKDELPRIDELLTILWGALQPLNKGYTMQKVWELYDKYIAEGHDMMEMMDVIVEVMKVSGFIKNDDIEEMSEDDDEKNV